MNTRASSRTRLERALSRAFVRRGQPGAALREAAYAEVRELRAQGLNADATLEILAAVVENVGRARGADRISLISGQPSWTPIRTQVLDSARVELSLAV